MRILGYHGTTTEVANLMCNSKFQIRSRKHHWLGQGLYFFQEAPLRALEWAKNEVPKVKNGSSVPAVVGAILNFDPEKCIDLLDIKWCDVLLEKSRNYLRRYAIAGGLPPKQKSIKYLLNEMKAVPGVPHRFDCDFIDTIISVLEKEKIIIQAVRAAFIEGQAILPTSHLFHRAHVQITVRENHFSMIKKCFKVNIGS